MRHVTAQQLSAFLDGALSGVSRELVTRHLAACADCRERHALWHIYDEVLQRVLSWEPDEHTMEEASARVELALTAERRGLTPPEFTSVLHPVIAPNPGAASPSASGMFPTLPPVSQHAAPRPVMAAPPTPQPPAPAHITPSANAYPLDPPAAPSPPPVSAPPASQPPAFQPPPPPRAPYGTAPFVYPPEPPAAAPPPYAPPPPPAAPAQWYPPPAPQAGAPPQWYPPPAHVGAPQQWYSPPPPPGWAPPISVHEDLRPHAAAPAAPWSNAPSAPKKHSWGPVLAIGAALLVMFVLTSPWVPDVIRIRVPAHDSGTPTVELVHHDASSAATDPQSGLAERTSSEPPPAPYRALAATADSTAAHAEPQRADSVPPPPPPVVTPVPKPAATAKPHTPAHIRPRTAPDEDSQSQDEGGSAAGVEHSSTFIPVQIKTEVQLSPSPKSSPAPAPATDTVGDQALPLLCGEVVDESGAPIEGVRIQVMVPSLSVRTDKRGRFCVALPAGEHTFLVDAAGYSAVTRGVELTSGTFETHITLTAAH